MRLNRRSIEQRIKLLRQKAEQRLYREQARSGTLPDGAQAPPGAKKVKAETTVRRRSRMPRSDDVSAQVWQCVAPVLWTVADGAQTAARSVT